MGSKVGLGKGVQELHTLLTVPTDGDVPAARSLEAPNAPTTPTRIGARAVTPTNALTFGLSIQGLLQVSRKIAAAVLIGAGGVPFVGSALAQSPGLEAVAPIALPTRVATVSAEWPGGPVRIESAWQLDLYERWMILLAQQRQYEATRPVDPVTQRDVLRLERLVQKVDTLFKKPLPANLLADLEHLETKLRDLEPGQLQVKLERGFLDLPSFKPLKVELPRVDIGTPEVRSPAVQPYQGPGALLKQLLLDSPTGLPDQAQQVLQVYSGLMANADRSLSRYPDFAFRTRSPLVYQQGGALLLVPPGAQLIHKDGQFRLEAPNLLFQKGGLLLVANRGSINLGTNLDGLSAEKVDASGRNWKAHLEGATLGVIRSTGVGLIRAESADFDLVQGKLHLEKGELRVGPTGDANLLARNLSFQNDRLALNLEGLDAQQTRTGTRATADHLALTSGSTRILGDALEIQFNGDRTAITGALVEVHSGNNHLVGTNLSVAIAKANGGGQTLHLDGQDLRLENGDNRIFGQGHTQVDLLVDKNGQLRTGSLSGDQLSIATKEGQAQIGQGQVAIKLDERGVLRELSTSGQHSNFNGHGYQLGGEGTDLLAHFDAQGRLQDLAAKGGTAFYQSDRGRLDAQGGQLKANFVEGRLMSLDAQANRSTWLGSNGTQLAADRGRLTAVMDQSGALSQVNLQAGTLDATLKGGQHLNLADGQGQLQLRPDGSLIRAVGQSAVLDLSDAQQKLHLEGLKFAADFDEAGRLTTANGQASKFRYDHQDGTYLSTGRLQVDLRGQDGELRGVGIVGDTMAYRGKLGELNAEKGQLNLELGAGGVLERARFDVRNLTAKGSYGQLAIGGEGWLEASFDPSGTELTGLRGHADRLNLVRPNGTLELTGGELTMTMANGQLSSALAHVESGSYRGGFGALTLTQGSDLSIQYNPDGSAQLAAQAGRLNLANNGGLLDLRGGHVEGELGPDGLARRLLIGAEHLGYQGKAEGDHPLSIDLANPEVVLTTLANGGQQLDAKTGAGSFLVNGHRVSLDGLSGLKLATTKDGEVDLFSARFPGHLDFVDRDGDLSVLSQGLGASYQRDGSELRLDFQSVDVALLSKGLTARIEGGEVLSNDRQLSVHIDRATLLKTIGQELNVDVQAVTVHVSRGADGGIRGLDVGLGRADAHISGLDVLVRTPLGEAVRLHVRTDDQGKTIKEAFLQIPEGGEIRLAKDDLALRLGGQRLSFTHGDDGVYRLLGESLDISAKTKSATVAVNGGDAQVSLDPASGRLVIDHIRGTSIDVQTGNDRYQLNVKELERFMVRMTKFEGGATGAALHLIPVDDGSRLTAELHADFGGIPVSVQLKDAHELKAIGQISPNQVHVYAGDPSGQGRIKVGVGPLEFKGSAVELVGRYHAYDAGRLTESIHQFLTTNGTRIFSGVSFEDDGVVRLGTNRQGLNGELAVLLPKQHVTPGYRFFLTPEPSDALGLIGSVGYRGDGWAASVFTGLVPGSHVTLNVKQGSASLAGIPLPSQSDLPTTAIGGLRLDLDEVQGGRLGVIGGGLVNPAGLTNNRWLVEKRLYGAFGGIEWRNDRVSVGLTGSVAIDKNGKPKDPAAMLTIGVNF